MMRLRSDALAYLETMRVGSGYRLSAGASPSLYALCFAIYLRHLLNDLDSADETLRAAWIDALHKAQQPSGQFFDDAHSDSGLDPLHDGEHLSMQLTTFCLGALRALGTEPRHPLGFLKAWTPEAVRVWLDGLDWYQPWNSGNKSMFLGICLGYSAHFGADPEARASLNAWFDWHDAKQNPRTGFWGNGLRARYIDGLGGAYHQWTVYRYFDRPVAHEERIVDRVLLVQCEDGMFSPLGGGATCYEMDAVDVLVHIYRRRDYRREDIRCALGRVLEGILRLRNADGGFGWGRWHPFRARDFAAVAAGFFRHRDVGWLYLSMRAGLVSRLKPRPILRTGWADAPRDYEASSVFDTWFRLVTIAEISSVITTPYSSYPWQYLTVPGLGWFPESWSRAQ